MIQSKKSRLFLMPVQVKLFSIDWSSFNGTLPLVFNGLGRSNEPYMLQNHINYSVFNGSNVKLYFNLLIEISSNNFLNTSLDFLGQNLSCFDHLFMF